MSLNEDMKIIILYFSILIYIAYGERLNISRPISCTADENLIVPLAFRKSRGKSQYHPSLDSSYCPDDSLLEKLQESNSQRNRDCGVFVNIGFSKGYNFAKWMNIFVPWSKMTTLVWNSRLRALNPEEKDSCGTCNECNSTFNDKRIESTAKGEFVFIGLDANGHNIKKVSEVFGCPIHISEGFSTINCSD